MYDHPAGLVNVPGRVIRFNASESNVICALLDGCWIASSTADRSDVFDYPPMDIQPAGKIEIDCFDQCFRLHLLALRYNFL